MADRTRPGGTLDLRAVTDEGVLYTPMPLPELTRHELVEAASGGMRFQLRKTGRSRPVPPSLLDAFVRRRTTRGLVGFARQWGPLGVYYNRQDKWLRPDPARLSKDSMGERLHSERIEWWHRYRALFASLLAAVATVDRRTTITAEEVEFIRNWQRNAPGKVRKGVYAPATTRRWGPVSRPEAALASHWALERLREECGLHPTAALQPNASTGDIEWQFQFRDSSGGITLIGALTIQLMSVPMGGGFGICKECREPFQPTRDSRKFCTKCQAVGAGKKQARGKSSRRS